MPWTDPSFLHHTKIKMLKVTQVFLEKKKKKHVVDLIVFNKLD
jgi:hypothetical protein